MRPPLVPTLETVVPPRNPWLGALTSMCIHGSLLVLVLWAERKPDFNLRPQADSVELAARQARQVGMIFIPPPAPSERDGRSRVPRPAPAPVAETPPPPSPLPSEQSPPKGDEGAPSEEDNVPADGGSAPPTEVPDGITAPIQPTETPRRRVPSIAFRGGRQGSSVGRTDAIPAWREPPSLAGATPRCRPGPPRRATDPVEWGVVAGRIYQMGTTIPLAGATLSVLGSTATATSNENGEYTLRFDSWPLRNCEAQFVRVTLDGFVTQTLTLTIGAAVQSDVQLRGR